MDKTLAMLFNKRNSASIIRHVDKQYWARLWAVAVLIRQRYQPHSHGPYRAITIASSAFREGSKKENEKKQLKLCKMKRVLNY